MSAIDDITDADRQEAHALAELVDNAELDWLQDALHAVLGVCSHHTGSLTDQIREVVRYELDVDENDDHEPAEPAMETVYLPGDAP